MGKVTESYLLHFVLKRPKWLPQRASYVVHSSHVRIRHRTCWLAAVMALCMHTFWYYPSITYFVDSQHNKCSTVTCGEKQLSSPFVRSIHQFNAFNLCTFIYSTGITGENHLHGCLWRQSSGWGSQRNGTCTFIYYIIGLTSYLGEDDRWKNSQHYQGKIDLNSYFYYHSLLLLLLILLLLFIIICM